MRKQRKVFAVIILKSDLAVKSAELCMTGESLRLCYSMFMKSKRGLDLNDLEENQMEN